jgi:tetratricopeptide (TPR) repeat protein
VSVISPKNILFFPFAAVILLGVGNVAYAASGELFQIMQRENAELKKQTQDLRVEIEALRKENADAKSKLLELSAESAALSKRLAAAKQDLLDAQERAKIADQQASQAVAAMREFKQLLQTQADAVTAQKTELSESELEKRRLTDLAEREKMERSKASAAAEAAMEAENNARTLLLREEAIGHYNLAVVLSQNGKFKDAEKQFAACLELLPDDADTHYNLGVLYEDRLRQPAKAIHHYRRFLEIKPDGRDSEMVRSWLKKLEKK